MRRGLTFIALAAAAVLAAPSTALAAYVPRMLVAHEPATAGAQAATRITIAIPRTDDATAKVQVLVPVGYQLTLPAPGAVAGTATAQVLATAISPDTIVPLEGPIRAADPAQHAANQCAPGTHSAVWVAELSFSGQTLAVPLYVDAIPAANQAALGASHTIQVCFGSPDVPPAQGGAALGAKVLSATLALDASITRTPAGSAQNVWRGVFTPWTPGTGTANVAGTVEARSVAALPKTITLRVVVRRRTVTLSGQLSEGGVGVASVTVQILRTAGSRGRPPLRVFSRRTTDASGRYSHRIRFRRAGLHRFQVRAVVSERDLGAGGCTAPSVAPAGCVSATAAGFRVQSPVTRLLRIR